MPEEIIPVPDWWWEGYLSPHTAADPVPFIWLPIPRESLIKPIVTRVQGRYLVFLTRTEVTILYARYFSKTA